MNEKINVLHTTINISKLLNCKLHAEKLNIPVYNNFKLIYNNDPRIIISAKGNGFFEQLLSDGPLKQDETFEDKINLVIKNTKEYMKSNCCDQVENSFRYLKDYSNGVFNFKIYMQDLIINNGNIKKVIRTLNAFFVEKEFNDFYQFSLSMGPFEFPTEQLILNKIDLENDLNTKNLNNMMNQILENLKYKNSIY